MAKYVVCDLQVLNSPEVIEKFKGVVFSSLKDVNLKLLATNFQRIVVQPMKSAGKFVFRSYTITRR